MANQSQKLWFKKTLVITVEHYGLLQFGTMTMTKTMKNITVINYDTPETEVCLQCTLLVIVTRLTPCYPYNRRDCS